MQDGLALGKVDLMKKKALGKYRGHKKTWAVRGYQRQRVGEDTLPPFFDQRVVLEGIPQTILVYMIG